MRLALLFIVTVFLASAAASNPGQAASKPSNEPVLFTASTFSDNYAVLTFPPPPENIIFTTAKGRITISLKDGSVKIPEGMVLDEASKQFWLALAAALPYVRHQLIYGEDKKP